MATLESLKTPDEAGVQRGVELIGDEEEAESERDVQSQDDWPVGSNQKALGQ